MLGAIKEELLHLRGAGVALSSPIAKVHGMTKLEVLLPQVLKPYGPLSVSR